VAHVERVVGRSTEIGRFGATTSWPQKPVDQLDADEEPLRRLVNLKHQRATEKLRGKSACSARTTWLQKKPPPRANWQPAQPTPPPTKQPNCS